jgi:hypothetical protein
MKLLFYLSMLAIFSLSSCKEQNVSQDLPLTSLANLSTEQDFSFSVKSSTVGKLSSLHNGASNNSEYLVVINDQNTYMNEIVTKNPPPFIDFATHTLLAVVLEYRGNVTLRATKEGSKTILKVIRRIPDLGPQGAVISSFSAIVPKVDSANLVMELINIKVK